MSCWLSTRKKKKRHQETISQDWMISSNERYLALKKLLNLKERMQLNSIRDHSTFRYYISERRSSTLRRDRASKRAEFLAWLKHTRNNINSIKSSHTFCYFVSFTFLHHNLSRAHTRSYPLLAQLLDFSVFLRFFLLNSSALAAYFFFETSAQETQFAFNIGAVKMWKKFLPERRKKSIKRKIRQNNLQEVKVLWTVAEVFF